MRACIQHIHGKHHHHHDDRDDDPNTKLRLLFPKDVTMLDAEAVRQYNLMGDSLTTLAQFPKTSNLLARRIVHSEHHKAWLIFFSAKTAKSAYCQAPNGQHGVPANSF